MKAKILIIEDTDNVRENIAEILESEDFETHAAENGEVGIDMAKKIQPDLILCDIMMPGMDGYQVIERLRSEEITATTPFIFLTAKGTVENIREGMLAGADDYIPKPFTIEQLLSAVNTRLQRIESIKEEVEEVVKTLSKKMGLPFASDINEMMKAIVGFSEMISSGYMDMEKHEIADLANLILSAGMRLKKTVSKTLNFYRLEALEVNREELENLKQVVVESVEDVIEYSARNISINARRDNDLVLSLVPAKIRIPVDILEMIIEELIENAIKFSTRKTEIMVETVVIKDSYNILIRDEGVGISNKQIKRVDAFVRYEDRVESNSGLGIGLHNAKKATELFGGTFSIDSEDNEGTIVTVRLPLVKSD
jgi:DNA-binding response OmpR family regulator/anti-sigma regulatory factor (Ser/Thr protein kinase)